ncbi:charged multivesicular body protein 6-like [Sycon ciliatum]|uniref:charged multivesicular body protein 6-like n=1 Tax=Sycon ciliatum TaxID=27933 RepID=UPI0020A89818|eukprot:scpid50113/ scgid11326/ Charged multivesicular body protein 6-A; Chromatin-modifying protein 6-A
MGSFFAKKSPPPEENRQSRVTDQDKAVLGLKQQRDKLKQYQKQIEGKLEKDRKVARDLLKAGKKDKALLLLKKKRYMEGLLTKTDNQMNNLEEMVQTLEFAQIEVQVVQGLEQGNESLKALHDVFSLEDVERIMDDTRDAVEYQQEIDSLLGSSLTNEDEESVLRELEELTAAQTAAEPADDMRLPDAPATEPQDLEAPAMPDVPSAEPGEAKATEERTMLAA